MEFNLDSLAVFKLMNSEVIICEIVSENETQVMVRYAIRALEVFNGEENEVSFTQWIPFTDDLIIISRHGILAYAPPSEEMQQMYLNRAIMYLTNPPFPVTIETWKPTSRQVSETQSFTLPKSQTA